jgi:hypothetical protein
MALDLAKAMLSSLDGVRASEAKVMFTVIFWFLQGLYHLGYELHLSRGEELPLGATTGAPGTLAKLMPGATGAGWDHRATP